MQGQVFVPYTGIGGFNMNTGIMPMSVGGSSTGASLPDGETVNTFYNILWTLPGGISNRSSRTGYQGGEWGYLIKTQESGALPWSDKDVIAWLQEKIPGCMFDADGNLTVESLQYEEQVRSLLNTAVYQYFYDRVLKLQGGSSYDDFVDYFGMDICVFMG